LPFLSQAYGHLLVESLIPDETSGRHGLVHIRPLEGQNIPTSLFVSCSKKMSDLKCYPLGTRFRILAKLTNHEGKGEFLYSNPRDPVVVVVRGG
jgi:hypothetical protein